MKKLKIIIFILLNCSTKGYSQLQEYVPYLDTISNQYRVNLGAKNTLSVGYDTFEQLFVNTGLVFLLKSHDSSVMFTPTGSIMYQGDRHIVGNLGTGTRFLIYKHNGFFGLFDTQIKSVIIHPEGNDDFYEINKAIAVFVNHSQRRITIIDLLTKKQVIVPVNASIIEVSNQGLDDKNLVQFRTDSGLIGIVNLKNSKLLFLEKAKYIIQIDEKNLIYKSQKGVIKRNLFNNQEQSLNYKDVGIIKDDPARRLIVWKNDYFSLAERNLKILTPFIFKQILVLNKNRYCVTKGGLWFVINGRGKTLSHNFDSINRNKLIFGINLQDSSSTVLNRKKTHYSSIKSIKITNNYDSLAVFQKGGLFYGYSFKSLIPELVKKETYPFYATANPDLFLYEKIPFSDSSSVMQWGIENLEGRKITEPIYYFLVSLDNNFFLVSDKMGGKKFLLDKKGNTYIY